MAESNGRGWSGRGPDRAPGGRGLARVRLGVEVFSTGMIALMAGCSARTVKDWVDSGELPGWHLHGSGRNRRVARADLLAFARRTGQRGVLLALEGQRGAALACGVPGHALPPGVGQAPSFFALGLAFGERRPRAVLLGPLHGRGAALEVCRQVAAGDDPPRLVGLAAEDDGDEAGWRGAGCAAVLRLPCSVEDVRAALGEGVDRG
jgi:excisionase family DNA binding protein